MIIALVALAHALPPAPDDAASKVFETYVRRADKVSGGLVDATWVLHQEEYVDGSMQPLVKLNVKWRSKDNAVYMQWTGDVNNGRELLWVPSWNDRRLYVKPGGFLPNVSLATDSRLATRGQRHTVEETSIQMTVSHIVRGALTVHDSTTLVPNVEDLGTKAVAGETAHCFITHTDKGEEPTLYSYRSDICFSERSGLPVSVTSWDVENGQLRLVESYVFENLQVNPGLPDSAFTTEHEGYGF